MHSAVSGLQNYGQSQKAYSQHIRNTVGGVA